jgi:hypothetical protein
MRDIIKIYIAIFIVSIGMSCAWLKDQAIQKGKDVAANTTEDKTIEIGKYLKEKYNIDIAKDGINNQALQIISEELKQGHDTSDTLKNSLKGLLMLLFANGGAGLWAYLKGKNFKQALIYLSEKIEKAHEEGKSVEDLKGMLKAPEKHEATSAAALTKFINKKFPLPTLKKRKDSDK